MQYDIFQSQMLVIMEYLGHTNLLYPFPEFLCVCVCICVYKQNVLHLITLKLVDLLGHCKDMKITEHFSYILIKYMFW